MKIFLVLLFTSISFYFLVLLSIYIIHAHFFYKRFVPDGNIKFYNEKDFNCIRKDASFKIKTLKAEEQIEYMKTIDFSELGKLDIDLMNQIISFFNE